jgi:hypothetical protein
MAWEPVPPASVARDVLPPQALPASQPEFRQALRPRALPVRPARPLPVFPASSAFLPASEEPPRSAQAFPSGLSAQIEPNLKV